MGTISLRAWIARAALLVAALAAGCAQVQAVPRSAQEALGLRPTATYTPDATLQAIALMLTETRGAPTITPTPYWTPTPTPTITPTPLIPGSRELPGKVGERIVMGSYALTVIGTSQPAALGSLKPKAGLVFLDVDALIENLSGEKVGYTRIDFQLVRAGAVYAPLAAAAGPLLLSGDLLPGEWVRGHIAFAIPPAPAGLRLGYEPAYYPALASAESGKQVSGSLARGAWVDLGKTGGKAPIPSTPPSSAAAGLPGPGQVVQAGGLSLTVGAVTSPKQVAFTKPAQGSLFLDLEVTIRNETHPLAPFNGDYFRLKDANGYEYSAIVLPVEEIIQAGSLRQGQQVRGHVLFEVPAGSGMLVLNYLPQVLDSSYSEIRVGIKAPEK